MVPGPGRDSPGLSAAPLCSSPRLTPPPVVRLFPGAEGQHVNCAPNAGHHTAKLQLGPPPSLASTDFSLSHPHFLWVLALPGPTMELMLAAAKGGVEGKEWSLLWTRPLGRMTNPRIYSSVGQPYFPNGKTETKVPEPRLRWRQSHPVAPGHRPGEDT